MIEKTSWINRPNLLSLLILAGIAVIAIVYGVFTYQNQPAKKVYPTQTGYVFSYRLGTPDQRIDLPEELLEISDLSALPRDQVLSIQDERGMLYIYDLSQQKIVAEQQFGEDGDYEGVATVDGQVFVLEADGDIHRVDSAFTPASHTEIIETVFTRKNDTESLCYDPVDKVLLITPKEELTAPEEREDGRRGIYAFDPKTNTLTTEPLYAVDENELGKIVYGEARRYLFKPSAMAVEPNTGYIYLLASVGKVLVVIDRQSRIQYVELLNPAIFQHPEGLAFDEAGQLLISNEGADGQPGNILRYTKQQNLNQGEKKSQQQ